MLFIALVFSLVIPRVAWGAHISGHEETIATAESHVHHGDHSHEVIDDKIAEHAHDSSTSDETEGFAHNHLPLDVLSVMADVDGPGFSISAPFPASSHSLDRRGEDPPTKAPGSLLRPPRTA
ncbi:hypothetical protein [Erythrobacter sp. QSSC1-22B]|uniref:hypothetical protein n=1 Tax=Erythrobacter sp. QSSC1-22B TaxID=1860125 RepID=UPI00143A1CD9|nr:hypothetical protein [Erythrobacter sp. QSSC1-22B]